VRLPADSTRILLTFNRPSRALSLPADACDERARCVCHELLDTGRLIVPDPSATVLNIGDYTAKWILKSAVREPEIVWMSASACLWQRIVFPREYRA
jgi:hypothetical protein